MEPNVIQASVEDRRIKVGKHVPPTAGNVDHDYLRITLDSEWDGLSKRITFYGGCNVDGVGPIEWDGVSDVKIAWEVLREPGSFAFTIVGSENGVDRLVTVALSPSERIRVEHNGEDEGVEPSAPTEDVIRHVESVANDLEQKAASGYFNGKDGKPGDDGFSPVASVSKSGKVATVTVTDKSGTTTASVNDGADGHTPKRGTDYWTPADVATIDQHIDQRVGAEYEVMDKATYDALTSYEVGKLYMVRWQ